MELLKRLARQSPSLSILLGIVAEPQALSGSGPSCRSTKIKTGSVYVRRLRGFIGLSVPGVCLILSFMIVLVARWTAIGRVVLVFIYLDAFTVQALSGRSLRLLAIAEDFVLSYPLIVQFCFGPGSTALSC